MVLTLIFLGLGATLVGSLLWAGRAREMEVTRKLQKLGNILNANVEKPFLPLIPRWVADGTYRGRQAGFEKMVISAEGVRAQEHVAIFIKPRINQPGTSFVEQKLKPTRNTCVLGNAIRFDGERELLKNRRLEELSEDEFSAVFEELSQAAEIVERRVEYRKG